MGYECKWMCEGWSIIHEYGKPMGDQCPSIAVTPILTARGICNTPQAASNGAFSYFLDTLHETTADIGRRGCIQHKLGR